MNQRLILTRGAPASGKTTWANEFIRKNPNCVNLNRDDLRATMFPAHYGKGVYKPSNAREEAVSVAQENIAYHQLHKGMNVIVSDTNLNPKTVDRWREFLDNYAEWEDIVDGHLKFEIKDFYEDLDVLIDRNSKRDGGVPLDALTRMYYQSVEQIHPEWKVEPSLTLPPAIIVDVDGTLANHEGARSPYDASKVHLDGPHPDIINIVNLLARNYFVIIMTGRDGSAYRATYQWLMDNHVEFDKLYIRAEGDTRKDSIIKRELFDEHVRGQYNVEYVIDDRLQVIYMWRALGLRVLDVSGGTF